MSTEPITTVRLCTEADLPALHAREAHASARLAGQHLRRQLDGDYFFAIALRDDVPLGYGVLDCRQSRLRPELMTLWVYPESRRQGVARAVTSFLEQLAAAHDFVEVFLRVDPDNEAAIPLYITLDYTPTGEHVRTTYESVDETGAHHDSEQTDAVYRKSLLIR